MAKLSDDEVRAALEALPEWRREGDEIVRVYELPTFPAAIAFVVKIADLAEAANHHPDLDIRYTKVRVALTSHDTGGLTKRDVNLAKQIDGVAPATGA
jgi:4a-hydroxytetrahydrobiopterin dehydratase